MSELDFLSDFSDCTEFLLSSFSEEMKHASETDAEFSLRLFPVVEQLQSLIPKLMECSRIFSLSVHYNIQDSKGDA